jgi:hypothetical protein
MDPGASPPATRAGRARRGGLVGATAGIAGAVIVALAAALVVRLAHDVVSHDAATAARPVTGTQGEAALRLATRAFERFEGPPYDRSFGGVWVDDDRAGPRLVVGVVGHATPALAAALTRARRAGRVSTVPALHTWGELEDLTHRLARDQAALRRLGVELVEWGPKLGDDSGPDDATVPCGLVVVRLHRYTPALALVLLRRYPNAPLYVVPESASYPAPPDL